MAMGRLLMNIVDFFNFDRSILQGNRMFASFRYGWEYGTKYVKKSYKSYVRMSFSSLQHEIPVRIGSEDAGGICFFVSGCRRVIGEYS